MSSNYVSNEEILKEITDYINSGEYIDGKFVGGKISERLGEIIQAIAENFSNKGSFASYTWREDMVADAVFTCVKYIHNTDLNKPNPFAYITTIIRNAFINYIRRQKKHSDIKDICYKRHHCLDEETYIIKGINYEILRPEKRKRRKKKE